jgi:hypothetical protein
LQDQNKIRGVNGDFGMAMALCPKANPLQVKTLCEIARYPTRPPLPPRPELEWFSHPDAIVKTKDYRKIHWYCDFVGNMGKTLWSKYAIESHGALIIKATGTDADFAQNVGASLRKGWNGKLIIVDLPRKKEHCTGFLSMLECMKDGELTMTKYTGGLLYVPPCNVIVFANFWPKCSSLSLDRWCFHHILSRQEVKDVDTKYVTKALQAATVRRNMERHKKDMDKASVRELARIITMLECLDSVEAQEEAKRIVDNPECYCLEELIRFSKEAYRKYTGKSSRRVVRNRKNCSDSCEVELS